MFVHYYRKYVSYKSLLEQILIYLCYMPIRYYILQILHVEDYFASKGINPYVYYQTRIKIYYFVANKKIGKVTVKQKKM